jgi:hypothetical protein
MKKGPALETRRRDSDMSQTNKASRSLYTRRWVLATAMGAPSLGLIDLIRWRGMGLTAVYLRGENGRGISWGWRSIGEA